MFPNYAYLPSELLSLLFTFTPRCFIGSLPDWPDGDSIYAWTTFGCDSEFSGLEEEIIRTPWDGNEWLPGIAPRLESRNVNEEPTRVVGPEVLTAEGFRQQLVARRKAQLARVKGEW